jgi:hypothetical protein
MFALYQNAPMETPYTQKPLHATAFTYKRLHRTPLHKRLADVNISLLVIYHIKEARKSVPLSANNSNRNFGINLNT